MIRHAPLPIVAILVALAAAAPIAGGAPTTSEAPAAAGIVSAFAADCRETGGVWVLQEGSFFGTLGSGTFAYAVFVGDGSARPLDGGCAFRGLGALVVVA